MKRSIYIALLCTSITQASTDKLTRLPNNFYILDKSGKENTIKTSANPNAFIIIVAPTQKMPFFDENAYTYIKSLQTNTSSIPQGFLPELSSTGTTYSLYFNWEDQVGFKNIKDYGKIFAQGINYLTKTYNVPLIIICYNRAGLLANYASQLWNSTNITKDKLPLLIQIGTPVPTPASQYSEFMPNPKSINKIFFFYSKQPFVFEQTSLHPKYQYLYTEIPGLSIYRILVLINNKQPLQNSINSPLLINDILTHCMNAQINYKINKNLFLNLSTLKPETNGLVGIINYDDKTNSNEIKKSEEIVKNLEKTLERNLAFEINQGEFLRNTFRQQ